MIRFPSVTDFLLQLFDNYLPGFFENFLRTLDSNETWTKDTVHQSLIFWHWLDTQEIRNWITYNLPPISSPLIELNFHIFSVEQWVYKFPLAENCPLIIQGSFQHYRHHIFFDDQNIHSKIPEKTFSITPKLSKVNNIQSILR